MPVLIISSSADTLISPELSQAMADAIPDARLEAIQGAGHLSNLEAPEEFNRLLQDFVEEVRLSKG